jgi:hypothetical protein
MMNIPIMIRAFFIEITLRKSCGKVESPTPKNPTFTTLSRPQV